MSVRETTPDKRPDMWAPGRVEADTDGVEDEGMNGGLACRTEEVWCGG